ncbi:mRNA-degrading endonuclease toxin of MazEF toxin-antitoxin module [Arthrobacter sp. JUb119]|nr:mRNA-degrading endonuclease toxin of MazEF toxin-antitoxin module [Arthrobacter sp. JUb119]
MTFQKFEARQLWWFKDEHLVFPPDYARTPKSSRLIVITSHDAYNSNPEWPFVFGVPVSTSEDWATPTCVPLIPKRDNVTQSSWARVAIMQPLAKETLIDGQCQMAGKISTEAMEEIQASLLGMLHLPFEDDPDFDATSQILDPNLEPVGKPKPPTPLVMPRKR